MNGNVEGANLIDIGLYVLYQLQSAEYSLIDMIISFSFYPSAILLNCMHLALLYSLDQEI